MHSTDNSVGVFRGWGQTFPHVGPLGLIAHTYDNYFLPPSKMSFLLPGPLVTRVHIHTHDSGFLSGWGKRGYFSPP